MAQPENLEQPVDLREYVAVLRRRKWTILSVVAVLVTAGLLLSLRQTPVYEAESRLLITPLPNNPFPNVDTESQVVASLPVANLVREDLGLSASPDSLIQNLTVVATVDTEVATVRYASTDPQLAQEAANSFSENYIEYRRSQALETIRADERTVRRKIDGVRDQLKDVLQRIEEARQAGNDTEAAALETDRAALGARLGVLQQQLDDTSADPTVTLEGGQVLELATLPASPSSPDHTKNAVLAGIVGLLLGVGAAFVRERLDDRFSDRADVERVLGAPVLATVQRYAPGQDPRELVLLGRPEGPASEAYRSLRTTLKFITSQQGIKSVLVTSPSAGEGKTVTTANLGVALAAAGHRVALVSGDLRRPTLEGYFRIDNRVGLTTWLLGEQTQTWLLGEEIEWYKLFRETGIANVAVLPSGPIPSNPAELLASPALKRLIEELEANFDLVLIDSAPSLPVADTSILASHVGGVIVVLDATRTARSAGAHVQEQLVRVGANILGTVLNAFDPSSAMYASYYGSDGYYSSYRADRPAEVIATGAPPPPPPPPSGTGSTNGSAQGASRKGGLSFRKQ
ncbi:MAG: polysaccharide biosynthesis tyrosine autokinase [Actinomycetota bacterium]